MTTNCQPGRYSCTTPFNIKTTVFSANAINVLFILGQWFKRLCEFFAGCEKRSLVPIHIYVVDLRVPVGCWFKERAVLLFIHLHIPPTCCFLWTIKYTILLTMRNFSSIVTLINVMAEKKINHKSKGWYRRNMAVTENQLFNKTFQVYQLRNDNLY